MRDEFAFTLESRRITLDLLKPGTPAKEVWERFNDFMRRNGRPQETRLYCHGQGYNLVGCRLIRNDEPKPTETNLTTLAHPPHTHKRLRSGAGDTTPTQAPVQATGRLRLPRPL